MRSRSLVSTSSRALASCPGVKGEGDTHFERCVGLHVCKLQRCCQGMLCFDVGDGFDVQVHVASAKVSVHAGGASTSNLTRFSHDLGARLGAVAVCRRAAAAAG